MQIIINRRHFMLFFVIIFSFPTALAFARSPSFDCARAIRPDQRTICSDEQLIVLDLLADSAYQYLRSHLGKSQANKLNLPFINSSWPAKVSVCAAAAPAVASASRPIISS
jgi:uncharacterized protein